VTRTLSDPIKYFLKAQLFKVRLAKVTEVFGRDPLDSHLLSITDIAHGDEILKITQQFELKNRDQASRIF
jgi:hypothetical protein